MSAKNCPPREAQTDLAAHAKASAAAHEWAAKAIQLRAAGKPAEAAAAEKRAMLFLQQVLEIEARQPAITREQHVTKTS